MAFGMFPVCHWASGVTSPYFGGSNWLHRAALSGGSNGGSATIAFHCHFPGNDTVIGLANGANFGLCAVEILAGNLRCFFSRAGVDDGAYKISSAGQTFIEEVWHHVLLSFSGTTARLYVDGVDRLGATALHGDALNFTPAQFVVGAGAANGLGSLDGCLQDVYAEFNTFTDFSDPANRALFDRGALEAGTADVFLSGDPTGFETNQGSGGAFTRAGPALGRCDTKIDST